MEWVPEQAWLTFIKIDTPAGLLTHDLAASVNPLQPPSKSDAGITSPKDLLNTLTDASENSWLVPAAITAIVAFGMVAFQLGWIRRRALLR
jgi:hypothetical protein